MQIWLDLTDAAVESDTIRGTYPLLLSCPAAHFLKRFSLCVTVKEQVVIAPSAFDACTGAEGVIMLTEVHFPPLSSIPPDWHIYVTVR